MIFFLIVIIIPAILGWIWMGNKIERENHNQRQAELEKKWEQNRKDWNPWLK